MQISEILRLWSSNEIDLSAAAKELSVSIEHSRYHKKQIDLSDDKILERLSSLFRELARKNKD